LKEVTTKEETEPKVVTFNEDKNKVIDYKRYERPSS
jgi:hypothetical protein